VRAASVLGSSERADARRIAAGAHTTLFLATPGAALSELERHPAELASAEACGVCGAEDADDEHGELLECEKVRSRPHPGYTQRAALTGSQCDDPYHVRCLRPALPGVPEGEWFCPRCEADPGAPLGTPDARGPLPPAYRDGETNGGKRKAGEDSSRGAGESSGGYRV
jgi:hypothetical protein